MRPLHVIAGDIYDHWPTLSPYARPYLLAMVRLNSINEMYGYDTASSVVRYFLANATGWRGPDARRIKAELREMLNGH